MTVVEITGAVAAILDSLAKYFVRRPLFILPLVLLLFLFGGGSYSMSEEIIAFIPLLCALGTVPFRGDTSGVIFDSILNRAPAAAIRLNPDISAKLEEIIHKCLEKDRSLRYQRAADVRADLQRLKRDTESGKTVASGAATSRWSRQTMLIGALAFVLVITVIALTAFYFGRSSGHAPSTRLLYCPSLMPAGIQTRNT